ncbi:glycosyltransferase EpsE [Neobacillus niacini]|uniref:glycosyltransferase family 2 protein n=1 Tax=Neobacillus niacini TaxID=86668 RepID=UPI0027853309|nr:glycosyltransferase [Neobacillus niacini]MDQ1000333.1 glycosyltransferase EpsE [Neobacillus niacini]
MPRISVIMGVYNSNNEKIVKPAINSILDQTYVDLEFIICDDGSTDGTYELVKSLTKHDDRVILIRNKKNMGLAKSLNNCFELARGEYIARMDADDISLLDRLEKQVVFLDDNSDYDLVGCNAILFDEKSDWGYREMPQYPEKNNFLFGPPFIHPSILIRKSVMKALEGYRVEKETLRCEDYDLFMRLYAMGLKGHNIQERLLKVRVDHDAYKRRKYKYRIDEAKVRFRGFKMLHLMPIGLFYTIKPLVVGLIPQGILEIARQKI